MGPKVKFKLNKRLDKETAANFLGLSFGGVDFGAGILATHPELKKTLKTRSKSLKKKMISDYVDNFYLIHNKELKETLAIMESDWEKKEKMFFDTTNKIFNSFPWSKGKYIGYLSIFNCNPRFLRYKNFQIFYKNRKDFKRLIAHELLHFIFYSYLNKKCFNLSKNKKWVISEIFNAIILNQRVFVKLISPAKELGYPEYKKETDLLTKEWERYKIIDRWIQKAKKTVP